MILNEYSFSKAASELRRRANTRGASGQDFIYFDRHLYLDRALRTLKIAVQLSDVALRQRAGEFFL